MIIETKFNFGDEVYAITTDRVDIYKECPACSGRGYFELDNGETSSCPKCDWRSGKIRTGYKVRWKINYDMPGIVQNIRLSLYISPKHESERVYMLDKTGVGSGTLWKEENLFSTKEDAEIEINKRNLKLEEEESSKIKS